MATSDSIVRNNVDSDGLDFATLRQEGIAFAQELSGNLWTDYNTHDPGVTILEQFCFGLTELAYQAGISVADYLANSKGKINYAEFGLLKPHDALPSAPVTPSDYCKLLLDAIPSIDRIEFIPLVKSCKHYTGLYRINIKLLEPITSQPFTVQQKSLIIKAVHEKYSEWRNLNEDIDDIVIEDAVPCFLTGTVETNGKRNPAEIHADIFFQCARKISSNIRIERYEHVFASGISLAEIFTGPLTQHGYISEAPSQPINTPKVLDELSGLIAQIGGVKKVYDIQLVDSEGKAFTPDDIFTKSFYLSFPELHQPELSIYFNAGKTNNTKAINSQSQHNYEKHLNSSKRHLQKLEFEYRAFRTNKGNASQFYPLPHANVPQDQHYYSIQNHFPDIYGINAAGVPHWASQERKLSALQLKAYLYPFEQIMANFQQMLQHLKSIFSLNERDINTYFAEFLDNSNIPNIETLFKYDVNPGNAIQRLNDQQLMVQRITKKYDNAIDRKNRALDSLLAIYGEEFSQDGLLEFNYYHQELPELWAIENKLRYLKNIRDLSARRNGAFNAQLPHWGTENLSWIQKKISILLGLESFNRIDSLSNIFSRFNLQLVADDALLKSGRSEVLDDANCVPHLNAEQLVAVMNWQYNPSKPLSVCYSMLTHGLTLDSYRLIEKNNEFYVYFRTKDKSVLLKKSASKEKAIDYIYKFKKIITDANFKAEGFFMLEHLLLRSHQANTSSAINSDFFKAQLSFVFPVWPARFSNPAFQQYAEKIICNNLPAHVFPNVYWVEHHDMSIFETLYQNWIDLLQELENCQFLKAQRQANAQTLDVAANALINWLSQHQVSQNYWV
jgi:hypothetical protein